MKSKFLKNIVSFGFVLLLAACGFKLVGKMDIPDQLNYVYVQSELTHSPFTNELESSLRSAGVILTSSPADAKVIIDIMNEKQSTSLTGNGTTQETRKYRITYAVTFVVEDATGKKIYGPTTVSSSDSLYIYSGQVLGNNNETTNLIQQLQRENIQKVMLKLTSTNAQKALAKATMNTQDKDETTPQPTK